MSDKKITEIKESYMCVNIHRVITHLAGTPFKSTVAKLKALIDSFAIDDKVAESYVAMIEETQREDNDLEFEYRCALLDVFKAGLGIPYEIVDDPYDIHTVCYDAINEYDESLLVDKETQNMIEDMASDKHNVDTDNFLDSAEMFMDKGYIDEIDGDSIMWNPDLCSSVCYAIYMAELDRLDSI